MKVLVVDPGADWSTRDVYDGVCHGLRTQGVNVLEYRYGRRFSILRAALMQAWKKDPDRVKPTDADAALWTSELAVTWALRHQPDWMLVVSGMYFHPDALILARRAGLRVALLLTESPYDYEQEWNMARLADLCWTNERTAVEPLRSANPQTYYLPHAYHPERHTPEASAGVVDPSSPFYRPELSNAPQHDVVFVGTGFQERVELLSAVDWSGLDFGLYGTWLLKARHRLRKYTPLGKAGIIENTATAALYARAKVGLNLFRQSKGFGAKAPRLLGAESLNPRSYELAATGCFHISDRRPEVEEVFGDLVPTFTSAEELTDLLRYWTRADAQRMRRAAALPAAVRGHSWVDRAAQVVRDLRRADRRDAVA